MNYRGQKIALGQKTAEGVAAPPCPLAAAKTGLAAAAGSAARSNSAGLWWKEPLKEPEARPPLIS